MSTDPAHGARPAPVSPPPAADSRKSPNSQDPTTPPRSFVFKNTLRSFSRVQCADMAAGLTFYSVLAIFPAAIALLSILGVLGQADAAVRAIEDVLAPLVSADAGDRIVGALENIAANNQAGLLLILGLLGALWSASGYVTAFSRAMNRIYGVEEGRPVWTLRPMLLILTLLLVVLQAAVLLMIATTGPVAASVGDAIGLEDQAVLAWEIAKWPVVLLVMVLIVALLYFATPNVKQPRFRWVSVGALLALLTAVVALVAFGFYAAFLGSYDATYGALAGVVLVLVNLWLINLALLFGAVLDSEVERGRELQAGIAAEERLQLPPRNTRGIAKEGKKRRDAIARARAIRERATQNQKATKQESVTVAPPSEKVTSQGGQP